MRKLIIPIGISGSGKTTWSKEYCENNPNARRISRDDLRELMTGLTPDKMDIYYQSNIKDSEDVITDFIEQSLINNYHEEVILDATNLRLSYLNYYKEMADKYGYEMLIKEFPCTLEQSLDNQSKRTRKVSEDVVKKQLKQYNSLIGTKEFKKFKNEKIKRRRLFRT